MKNNFMVGVNYWASHAGTDMWINWDADTVRKDLAVLRQQGVRVLRVFPNWRDFQPVMETFIGNHAFREYRMINDQYSPNKYYLCPKMMEHFHAFCAMAEEEGLGLIVGLLTGWMSGRLFLPPALFSKNVFTDPRALYLEQLFIAGFVSEMKNEKSIIAWDLGNECNCMEAVADRQEAANWTALVTNAIRAQDASRPIVSGMHSLEMENGWTMRDQGDWTDLLTTHPYPYWVPHANRMPLDDMRTMIHATAQSQIYADLSGKPCLVEEIGTMGPMVCNDEIAAGFMRVNLWSTWAHGFPGLLWWCAFDQDFLTNAPYDWNMVERELGLMHRQDEPKPFMKEMNLFHQAMEQLNLQLPPARKDAVCILSWSQDQVGVGYMAYLLAKQAGKTIGFASCNEDLPESDFYLLPSIKGNVMSKKAYDRLKEKVWNGASLYISLDDGVLTEFEALTGFRSIRSSRRWGETVFTCEDASLRGQKSYCYELQPTTGETVLTDAQGNVLLGRHTYGKGTVWVLNYPMEKNMLGDQSLHAGQAYKVFKTILKDIAPAPITVSNHLVGMSYHPGEEADYAVLINYTGEEQDTGAALQENACAEVLFGCMEHLEPYGTAVIKIEKKA